jgi:predicted phosphodiesterase
MTENIVAVVSDIHANYEALSAVYADIQQAGIEKVICLGDIFGYGPDPIKCFDIAKNFSINIGGNHELWLMLKMVEPGIPLKGRLHKRAVKALDWTVKQFMGRQKSKTTELPKERLADILKESYLDDMIMHELDQRKDELKIPYSQKEKVKLSETIMQLDSALIKEIVLQCPDLTKTLHARLERRNKTKEIHHFLDDLEKKQEYRLENALFVHDDPVNPGSGHYTLDHETAESLGIIENRIAIEKITSKKLKFPGLEYVFLGHSHVLPKEVEANGINFIYVGSVGFTREKPVIEEPKKEEDISYASYITIALEGNRVLDWKPRIIPYSSKETRKKMIAYELDDKILL